MELFDNITYENLEIKNIFQQIEIDVDYLERNFLIDYYKIKDGERPDDIAYKFYNDRGLYWIPLKVNNMRDYFYDWPLSDSELKNFMDVYYTEKDDDIESLANSFLGTGDTLLSVKEDIKELLYQKFYTDNDNKKLIKMIKSRYIGSFIQQIRIA
jgi:hypothetical protein